MSSDNCAAAGCQKHVAVRIGGRWYCQDHQWPDVPGGFPQTQMYFDGETCEEQDRVRLAKLMLRVWRVVKGGEWITLSELASQAGGSEASVSARLRDLRKQRFGAHTVERRHVCQGLFEYRVTPNPQTLVEEDDEWTHRPPQS